MSTNAVMMRTRSFLNTLVSRLTQRSGRHCPSDYSGQCYYRQQVGNHLDELRSDHVVSLQLYLQGLGRREEQTCKRGTHRIPATEDHRCNRDKTAARSHLIGELVLLQRQINTSEAGQYSRESNGRV